MFVTYNYKTTLEDIDINNKYELFSIFKILENAGSYHSSLANNNIIKSTNNGRAWVLTDWYAELDFYPSESDSIKAITWSEPRNQNFITSRDFELYANEKIFGKATSRWAILDTQTGRPTKIEDSLIALYQPEEKLTFTNTKLPRIEMPENFSIEKQIQLRRSDIDYNGHVHNLNYIHFAMEVLPQEEYENRKFKHIHISYKLAVLPEEKIIAKYAKLNEKNIICIYNDKNELKTQIELY